MIRLLAHLKDRAQGKAPKGAYRHGEWGSFRRDLLQRSPWCSACGDTRKLEAHHVIPFFVAPERELDRSNVLVLCRRCHKFIGHFDNYRSWNPGAHADAATWLKKKQAARRRLEEGGI